MTPTALAIAADFIRAEESLHLVAYDDFTGKPPKDGIVRGTLTNGWGHTGPDVHIGQKITREKADEWLAEDLDKAYDVLQRHVPDALPLLYPHRAACLVSMAYNLGSKPFRMDKGLRRALDDHRWQDVSREIERWHWGNGKPGMLSGRRAREVMLWNGTLQPATAPVILRRGSRGPAVLELTRRLVALGLMSFPSSRFGPRTQRAVREFQGRAGLVADSIVGPKTWAALEAERSET